jgi:hypothetical protein
MLYVGFLFMWSEAAQPVPVASDYCLIAKPIFMSHNDTRGTKVQIDRENRKFKRICPK